MKVIFWKNKPIFTEIILLFIRQNTIPYGQRHYQWVVTGLLWPQVSATSLLVLLLHQVPGSKYLLSTKKLISNTGIFIETLLPRDSVKSFCFCLSGIIFSVYSRVTTTKTA